MVLYTVLVVPLVGMLRKTVLRERERGKMAYPYTPCEKG